MPYRIILNSPKARAQPNNGMGGKGERSPEREVQSFDAV